MRKEAVKKRIRLEPHLAARALMSAADRVRRELVAVLQPFDLTLQQFNVLAILLDAKGKELPTLEVAAGLVEQAPAITRLMNTLIAKKYLRRRACPEDRRRQLCSLTAEGLRVTNAALPIADATFTRIIGDLDDSEVRRMAALLDRVAPSRADMPRQ